MWSTLAARSLGWSRCSQEGWRQLLPMPGSGSQVNSDILTSYLDNFPVEKRAPHEKPHGPRVYPLSQWISSVQSLSRVQLFATP